MQLSYRGLSYEVNSPEIETTSDISARYRGVTYQVRRCINRSVYHSPSELKFRGIPYSK